MTEKGFATIFSLCLILVIALIVKGIQETEMNHAYETINFQAAVELQNAADSALVEVADKVLSGEVTLPKKPSYYGQRRSYQIEFPINKTYEVLGKITVSVWGENIFVQPYKVNYAMDIAKRSAAEIDSYFLFSMAQANFNGRKIYRRSFAYFDKESKKIHFMESPTSTYKFDTSPWKN